MSVDIIMLVVGFLAICAIFLILWRIGFRVGRSQNVASRPDAILHEQSQNKLPVSHQLRWAEVQSLLPETIETVPATNQMRGANKVQAPFAQAAIHGIAGAAPSLMLALQGGRYLKVVGPPEVLAQNLPFLHDKSGQMLGDFVGPDGKIFAKARFEPGAQGLSAAATAACIFQILSVATAQYYLHQITESLKNIEEKLDGIKAKLDAQQQGKVLSAMDLLKEIYTHNLSSIDRTGDVDWMIPTEAEFWSRMATAEAGLRQVIHGLESEMKPRMAGWISRVSKIDAAGNRVRIIETSRTRSEIIEQQIEAYKNELSLYRIALFAMMRWYQVVLSYDARSNYSRLSNRYNSMVSFLRERLSFTEYYFNESNYILVDAGKSWKDIAIYIIPFIGDLKTFLDEKRLTNLINEITPISGAYRESIVPLKSFSESLSSPSDFHLRLEETRGEQRFTLLAGPQAELNSKD